MSHHNGTEEPGGADEVSAAYDALHTGSIGLRDAATPSAPAVHQTPDRPGSPQSR